MFIYHLLRLFAAIAVCFSIWGIGYYIHIAIKHVRHRQHLSFSAWLDMIKTDNYGFAGKYTASLLIIALCSTLITEPALHQLVGIHNLKLKPNGTYCFYVEAHRREGNTYTLPAQISIETEIVDISEEKNKTYRYYYIQKVFFSNGGWLDTSDMEDVEIGEPSYYRSYDDDEWVLTLLNEHAYSPRVSETNNATWVDITFLLIDVTSISFFLFALCRKEKVHQA